jgi:hypothetical protein
MRLVSKEIGKKWERNRTWLAMKCHFIQIPGYKQTMVLALARILS